MTVRLAVQSCKNGCGVLPPKSHKNTAKYTHLQGLNTADTDNGSPSTSEAIVPSTKLFLVNKSTALIDACITKKEIIAESAATFFSAFAMPMATPTAKMIGRLSK